MYRLNEYGKTALKDFLKANSKSGQGLGRFIAELERQADDCLDDAEIIGICLSKYETYNGKPAVLMLNKNSFDLILRLN